MPITITYQGREVDNVTETQTIAECFGDINLNAGELATDLASLNEGKQDVITGATEDNIATFDADGNIQDSTFSIDSVNL